MMEQILETSFHKCCRLCAEEHEASVTIYSKEAESMLLVDKLKKYLLFEVDANDRLPKNVCIECCVKLKNMSEFIETARRSQDILLKRCLLLEEEMSSKSPLIHEIKTEIDYDDEIKHTQMEISVDPRMVLQNSEDTHKYNMTTSNDVTYLYNVDMDTVTIRCIKKEDNGDMKEGKPFPCPTCKRSFYTELALKNHSWSHTSEPPREEGFRCKACSEHFDSKIDLVNHLKEHKSDGLCQLCGREFRSERTYLAHMSVHLSTEKSFTCRICGRIYNTWGDLKTHSVTHSSDRPYPCTYCKKRFKRNQDLKFHINQHTGARPYKCPFCEKSFASSGNCYSHRTRMHPGRRIDTTKSALRTRDNGLRPIFPKASVTTVNGIIKYECQLCHHSFLKKDNYNYHMYQHTGVKPFNCSFCPDKFVTRRGLLIHHNNQHPGCDRPLALLTKNLLLK